MIQVASTSVGMRGRANKMITKAESRAPRLRPQNRSRRPARCDRAKRGSQRRWRTAHCRAGFRCSQPGTPRGSACTNRRVVWISRQHPRNTPGDRPLPVPSSRPHRSSTRGKVRGPDGHQASEANCWHLAGAHRAHPRFGRKQGGKFGGAERVGGPGCEWRRMALSTQSHTPSSSYIFGGNPI